jgi:hypothetical protein
LALCGGHTYDEVDLVASDPKIPEQVQATGKWLEDNDIPTIFSNAFAVQPIKNEFLLTFACTIPRVITKPLTADEAANFEIPIKPLVRIGMTPDRIIELIQLLQTQLNLYSQMTLKS